MKRCLSVEHYKCGSLKLIGQFCYDVIGYKTQVALVVIGQFQTIGKVRLLCSVMFSNVFNTLKIFLSNSEQQLLCILMPYSHN